MRIFLSIIAVLLATQLAAQSHNQPRGTTYQIEKAKIVIPMEDLVVKSKRRKIVTTGMQGKDRVIIVVFRNKTRQGKRSHALSPE